MIGYYIHHLGHGHLHRAVRLADELGEQVTGLSSLPRPDEWTGPWIRLPRDVSRSAPCDPTAREHLHWAPLGEDGLARRMAMISQWLEKHRPSLVVCDVSVEVALLCRLHGVRVATVVLPGDRGDTAHHLGREISDLLVAFWPVEARGMVAGLSFDDRRRLHLLGGLARDPIASTRGAQPDSTSIVDPTTSRSVVVLAGSGGGGLTPDQLERAQLHTPEWSWTVLGGSSGTWVEDPMPIVRSARVVVTHAGQNALAEVAAARRPAIVLPQPRPHREQEFTAGVLRAGVWPALVETSAGQADWSLLLRRAANFDGNRWASWCDGAAASRFADLIRATVDGDKQT